MHLPLTTVSLTAISIPLFSYSNSIQSIRVVPLHYPLSVKIESLTISLTSCENYRLVFRWNLSPADNLAFFSKHLSVRDNMHDRTECTLVASTSESGLACQVNLVFCYWPSGHGALWRLVVPPSCNSRRKKYLAMFVSEGRRTKKIRERGNIISPSWQLVSFLAMQFADFYGTLYRKHRTVDKTKGKCKRKIHDRPTKRLNGKHEGLVRSL